MSGIAPIVAFDEISRADANRCLVAWGHKMGPLERGNVRGLHYALYEEGEPVGLAMAATTITPTVGGGLAHLNRDNTIELARLCAARPHLCRAVLRLWREFVFPRMGYPWAMSYQDADIHNGNTYRFDGWSRAGYSRAGGTDRRSGRVGRNKWIWTWQLPGVTPVNLPLVHARLETAEA